LTLPLAGALARRVRTELCAAVCASENRGG